ncbi:ureidoglycolate lyase [Microbispora sp. H11081]|uniref:ureidoglycolate lyase n=1 Tax=Microbispora sp. H11081 TaxID=2729107 RepID=UPI0014757856|nr:ureidoglycolate lyase [Microbispora sp. H11081]
MLSPDSPLHTIKPQEFTAEAFAPFGEAMSLDATPRLPIDFYSGKNAVHGPVRLDCDTTPEFLVFRVGQRGDSLRFLERHVEMTQTMIPLNGQPYVAVVAPPQVPLENGFPVLDEVKAFIIPGDVSINLYRGTWHEPPFPSVDGQLFLITSHERLTRGLQCKLDENGELDQFDVEKRSPFYRTGQRVRVQLP